MSFAFLVVVLVVRQQVAGRAPLEYANSRVKWGAVSMDATEPQPVPPVHKLRWYQFSLRSLMIFVLVGGVLLGWAGAFYRRVHAQRRAVSRVLGLGGHVGYDYEFRNGGRDFRPRRLVQNGYDRCLATMLSPRLR